MEITRGAADDKGVHQHIRDELSFQVVIVNAWYNQCIMPMDFYLLMMPWTAASLLLG